MLQSVTISQGNCLSGMTAGDQEFITSPLQFGDDRTKEKNLRGSCYVDPNFQAARFYCDIEGHPDNENFKLALEELGFYASDVKFLGAYPAHPFRDSTNKTGIIN